MLDKEIKVNDIVYFARIIPRLGVYDVYDLKIRTVEETYFVGIDKGDKKSYLFSYEDIGKTVFLNRMNAVTKANEAEDNNKQIISKETYYEEY